MSLHVAVQKQQAVHTAGGNLFFAYKICYSYSHYNYSHSHSQLVAQNYSHSYGNPIGMGIPIPMHTSI